MRATDFLVQKRSLSVMDTIIFLVLASGLACSQNHFLKKIFIYLFLAALGLCCCTRTFSSCGEQGLPFVAVGRLLIVMASLVAEHRLQASRLQQLWHMGSVVVAHGLQSSGSVVVAHGLSCSAACGIFLDQGLNPCPLLLAGRFLTPAPPGKSPKHLLITKLY